MNTKNVSRLPFESLPLYTCLSPVYLEGIHQLEDRAAASSWRPALHLAAPCGLVNDPNGLHFDGRFYHVFCQWFPFGARHGMKHWFHFKSPDLKNWVADPNILIPDQKYEKNGCYSGNAWFDPHTESFRLYYTANYKNEQLQKVPLQAMAEIQPDGTIVKSPQNPILSGSPEGVGNNIRDPFVFDWKGSTYMLLGAESDGPSKRGMLLLYQMKQPDYFDYLGEVQVLLDGQPLDLGTMVECPGFIQCAGDTFLFLSLIGPASKAYSENRFAAIVLRGELDLQSKTFHAREVRNVDEGFDFYAPQPFYGQEEIPMYFGWFGNGDQPMPEDRDGWRHALTLPRVLLNENGVLKTPPHPQAVEGFPSRFLTLDGAGDSSLPIRTTIEPEPLEHIRIQYNNPGHSHILQIGPDEDFYTIEIDADKHQVILDRSHLQIPIDPAYGMTRSFPYVPRDSHQIDLYFDHSFNELYWDQGEKVLSFRACQPASQKPGISLVCQGDE